MGQEFENEPNLNIVFRNKDIFIQKCKFADSEMNLPEGEIYISEVNLQRNSKATFSDHSQVC